MTEYKKVTFGDIPQGNTSYFKTKEAQPGTVVGEGAYGGTYTSDKGVTHFIRLSNGDSIGVNETAKLRSLIEKAQLTQGTPIRLTYLGKNLVKKGKRAGMEAHDWNLEIAQA